MCTDIQRKGDKRQRRKKEPYGYVWMGVAWLVGTVAFALLTSAGQRIVEVLTEP